MWKRTPQQSVRNLKQLFIMTYKQEIKKGFTELKKSILDRANNPTKEEHERLIMLLKKNADRKKKLSKSKKK